MMERMRSLLLVTGLLVAVACTPDLVSAATCPSICSTKSLWGYGSQAINYQACECTDPWTGTAKRTGPNCVCDVCYKKEGAHVVGYAKQNGACAAGTTDCDACDIASLSGSGSGTKPKTTTPAPSSNSSSTSSKSGAGADADSSSDSSSGMATWQVALVICSCVLVFAVAVMTIMSCYCKTRNQMKDNDTRENETREYEQYWHPGATATAADARPVAQLANSGFGASLTQGGRSSFTSSHSRPNSTKNMPYSEPTYAENDRIGRPAARVSLGSKNDLPQVFNAFPPRDRPSHEVGSRKNIAIEL